jgi:NAD+ synthase (glutamine-hydrolysing)
VSFFNLYSHNFARAAVAVPEVRVADPAFNAGQTITLISQAAEAGAVLVVLPELGLSAYSCEDLFHQQALRAAGRAWRAEATRHLPIVVCWGCHRRWTTHYNRAAVIARGRIPGSPKTYPDYREFYELRQFTPGDYATARRSTCAVSATSVRHALAVFRSKSSPAHVLRGDLRGPRTPCRLVATALAGAMT